MAAYGFPTARYRTRLGTLVAGLGSLVTIWPTVTPATRPPVRSDLDALRGDTVRIGDDMRRVIERERERAQTAAQE